MSGLSFFTAKKAGKKSSSPEKSNMIEILLEPFSYGYMIRAMWVSVLVGGMCAFLSSYLMLKGLSLMGDALSHSIVPGVALAYLLALPYAVGAFFTGLLAAFSMALVRQKTNLREDTVIGLVFTTFFAVGLLLVSINPTSVNIQSIILGNILTIPASDAIQVVIISLICVTILLLKWKDLMALFFDENHARSIGLPVQRLKIMFFTLLSAATVAALQTVGACLVIAMVVTPGATAYLLADRFGRVITIAILLGMVTSAAGVYASYFLNASTGGIIVTLQTGLFLLAFLFAPRHGLMHARAVVRQRILKRKEA
jgi:manganese/iron transport system permease protein